MAYGTVNADVIGTSVAGSNLGAGNASIMKNRIINGAMVISQRNGTSSVSQTNGSYSLDRWQSVSYTGGATTGKFTVAQSSTAPAGFINSLLVTSSTALSPSSTDIYYVGQIIEGYNIADLGWGTSNGKSITVSFQVQSSLTGTFSAGLRNQNGTYSFPFTYTISSANTWTSVSVTIPAPPVGGTWQTDNSFGLALYINLQLGSANSAAATGAWQAVGVYGASGCVNLLATNGATLNLTGVQLEVGSSATGFEYVNYQTSLANCQRYYYNLETGYAAGAGQPIGLAFGISTSLFDVCVPFPVTMRTTPSIYQNTGTNYYQFYNALTAQNFTSFKIDQVSTTSIFLQNNSAITLTVGQGGVVYANNTNCQVGFSAEL